MLKGEIRWDKFAKAGSCLHSSDVTVMDKLTGFKKHLKWIELVPTGLRLSYVSIQGSILLVNLYYRNSLQFQTCFYN